MPIDHFGKGAKPDPIDPRDFKAQARFGAVIVDWTKRTGLVQKIKTWRNQNGSSSCVGQACSYKHDILRSFPDDPFSARAIYAQHHLSGGGMYIRDGILHIVKKGQARRSEVPEPQPQTESLMTDLTGITPEEELDDREADGYVLPQNDIEYTAWAVLNFGAVVLGVNGSNPGWSNPMFPHPPIGEPEWGHALCAVDIEVIDGKKYIVCLSSWTDTPAVHHLGEDYFLSGNVFNPWVIVPRKENMQLIKDKGTVYLVAGVNKKVKTGIASGEALDALFGDEPITDGDTSAIPQTQTLSDGFLIHKK